jgi:two-component system chemotaxis response regulator CheY
MSEAKEPAEKPHHFLVVDDDAESRGTVVEYLKSMGHARVTEAADGTEAMRALERDPSISFVISDWDMPLMNGLTFLQRLKGDPGKANLPFVIMTSPISHEAEKVMLAAENLVDGYLIKPFRSEALKAKIESTLKLAIRGPQKQVLLVDDDPDARAMVAEYLAAMGFKDVRQENDGKAALEYLGKNAEHVGLVVSDWDMPELNGLQLLGACKNSPSLREIPFLMITSQSSVESMKVVQAARASVDSYLLKPFGLDEIKKRIDALVEKERTRSEVQGLVVDAVEHVKHRHYQRALRRFEQVLKLDPGNETALRETGEILMREKGVQDALPYFKRLVDSNPYSARGYLALAGAYDYLGWLDKAIALLQAAIHQIGFSAELHFFLGKLYDRRGMTEEAKAELEKTLALQLDHQEARLMLEMIGTGTSRGNKK